MARFGRNAPWLAVESTNARLRGFCKSPAEAGSLSSPGLTAAFRKVSNTSGVVVASSSAYLIASEMEPPPSARFFAKELN
jgi:hypothetical protein